MTEQPAIRVPGLTGSINHISIAVSDLPGAMKFFTPFLTALDYSVGPIFRSQSGSELTVNICSNGTALNVWQAKPELGGGCMKSMRPASTTSPSTSSGTSRSIRSMRW
jgi:hypothetical protein